MIRIITCVLLLTIPRLSVASECFDNNVGTKVFYANGMFNVSSDIYASIAELNRQLGYRGYKFEIDASYNQSEVWYQQLVEVFAHKNIDNWSFFWQYLNGIIEAPDWFQEAIQDISANSHGVINDSDLAAYVGMYRKAIDECYRVLIVAHSQGNFYGNHAWSAIYSGLTKNELPQTKFKSLGLLSVASPASYVGSYLQQPNDHKSITDYVTLTNDRIMVFVRLFFPSTLLGNITNSHDDPDFWHHNFIDSYLRGNHSGPRMTSAITEIIDELEPILLGRREVESSSLKSAGYSNSTEILDVEFVSDGSVYRYYQVPESEYRGLIEAESHGRYFYFNIRSKYSYRKLIEGV
ncbi:KTSC domain-containing protein [Vibrio sp. HN007]|uniref:KTSC domain-containing protein n=1 Tax=Vibrio iocasae TaxID=3098914 RepID=UPI0035D4F48F